MSTPLWVTTTRGTSVGTATIATDGTCTIAAHGLVNGQQVTVASLTGGASTVLVVDAPYFVANATTNTFQLRPSPGAPVMTLASSGGAAVYQTAGLFDAQTLRNTTAGLIAPGNSSSKFISRTGVFPMGSETAHVTISGLTWTTTDLICAVRHATGGIYNVAHPTESGSLTAADPSQPRIDAIDLQIQDNALDSSGFARAQIVRVTGTPAATPVAPAVTTSAERLATFSVAAGSTSATVLTGPSFNAARGGIIPVTDSSQYPTSGSRYKGLALWDISLGALVVNTNAGSTWAPIASAASYASVRRIGLHTRTANSAGFTAETAMQAVTGLTLVTGRTYQIRWVMDVASSAIGDIARIRIREGNGTAGAQLQLNHVYLPTATRDYPGYVEAEYTAPASPVTAFTGTAERIAGSGTLACNALPTEPQRLSVYQVD